MKQITKLKKVRLVTSILFPILSIPSLHSQPALDRAAVAANEAEMRMYEAMGNTQTSSGSIQGTAPVQEANKNGYSADFPQSHFITAVGAGSNRKNAELNAFAELVKIFGVSITTTNEIMEIYSGLNNKVNSVFYINTNTQEVISATASVNTLIGAEIGRVWDNGEGIVYALAYINREKAIIIYTELIRVNELKIESLVTMSVEERNSFLGYSRYKRAEKIAAINEEFNRIVLVASGSSPELIWTGAETLNREAEEIKKNINIGITVTGDIGNRAWDAFAKVITNEGYRTQGNNPPYILAVRIDMDDLVFPNNNYIFCRYTVSANLVEKATGTVVCSYGFSGREGHRTFDLAKIRACSEIEKSIEQNYPVVFKEYIRSLTP